MHSVYLLSDTSGLNLGLVRLVDISRVWSERGQCYCTFDASSGGRAMLSVWTWG